MGSLRLPRVSIIIAFYKNEFYLGECIEKSLSLDYPDYEVIVVSRRPLNLCDNRVKFVLVESESQAVKKDAGVAVASGEICAFVDDDAYPSPDWLNGVKYFEDPEIGAVCGPGVTPPKDNLMQKASGVILSSAIGSWSLRFRYVPSEARCVDEGPGYNFMVRRSLLVEIGGFQTNFRSGEDTLVCEKIRAAGKKIFYAPDVTVYHHRRPLFIPHLRQVMNYGLHRGFFVKKFPRTSTRFVYFLPLLVVISFVIIVALLAITSSIQTLGVIIGAYFIAVFISALKISKSVKVAFLATVGTPLHHLAYVCGFLRGLLIKRLGEKPSH